MIHIHARKPDGTPSYEIEDFPAITDAIRGEVGDAAIINYSTGTIGVPVAKRIDYLRACRPEVAALNMGSMNYAKYSRSRKALRLQHGLQPTPSRRSSSCCEAMNELDIKPEHECFDIGHVGSLEPLIDMGVLQTPLHVDCVMGVVGGIPPTARNLAAMVDNIPAGSHWGVIGISREQWMLRGRRAHARRLDPGGPRGQPVPARRRDGPLQRRADRQGAADGRRRRAAAPPPSQRRARMLGVAQPRRELARMSLPLEGVRVLDLSRLLPGGFCSLLLADFGAEVLKVEDTGMGDYIRWAPPYYEGAAGQRQVGALPLAQPQQALDPHRPQERAAGARCCCASCATTTWCSSPSAPACSTASASAMSACARSTPGSSTARSPATARTAPSATPPGTT